MAHISRTLAEAGIAVLRFDFTGLGESEGDFADTNFSSNVADLIAAAEFLSDEFEAAQNSNWAFAGRSRGIAGGGSHPFLSRSGDHRRPQRNGSPGAPASGHQTYP